jgi:Calcineurin-like phosphoesterase
VKSFRVGAFLLAVVASSCGKGSPTSPTPPNGGEPPPGSRTAVLIGAGDIGLCGSPAVAATGQLIQNTLGDVFLAGDIAYPQGTTADFNNCFRPFWGHASDRWHPVPGNHEYESPGAAPYFQFFGAAAGPPGLGYYRFVLGEWLILMLNSENDTRPGSAQYEFVRQALQDRPARCQMAIWHRPVFTSGPNGPHGVMRDLFKLLDDQDVDVVVNGHEHFYERFSRQDADGRPDANGIRQFIVGTGGAQLYDFVRVAPNSSVRLSTHGVIRFTLRPDSYEWEFLEITGTLADNGFTPCH